jgi:phytoene/squalene synthetase
MRNEASINQSMAAEITKSASKQTFYTILLFVDRELVNDAFRAYGYFRWVDDILDKQTGIRSDKVAFVNRQRDLLETCYQGKKLKTLSSEELLLAEMVQNDTGKNPGLQSYLCNMMKVMEFDAERSERWISRTELSEYTRALATAVTDAMHYFIGHNEPPPHQETRYLAVTAAHITHMLRDTLVDLETGYYNIPREYLQTHGISTRDVESHAYQRWVCRRVELARILFKEGRKTIAEDKCLRRRMVAYAYMARFQWILGAIKRDNFRLRFEYRERKSLFTGMWMIWTTLNSTFTSLWMKPKLRNPVTQTIRIKEP